jgi:hypothetical protein
MLFDPMWTERERQLEYDPDSDFDPEEIMAAIRFNWLSH